ncbi:unnamed protein product [Arctogadus glacialis]
MSTEQSQNTTISHQVKKPDGSLVYRKIPHSEGPANTHTTMVSQRADPGGQSSSVGHFPYIVNLHYSRIVQNIEKDSVTQSDVQEKHDSVRLVDRWKTRSETGEQTRIDHRSSIKSRHMFHRPLSIPNQTKVRKQKKKHVGLSGRSRTKIATHGVCCVSNGLKTKSSFRDWNQEDIRV